MSKCERPNTRASPRMLLLLGAVLLLLGVLLLSGCTGAAEATPSAVPPPVEEETEEPPTPLPPPDQSAQIADWESGPHAHTYDLGKGPNTYCSRCHSPQNWDPESRPGPPPNCITCKFPTDAELRIATTMDFVSEEDWVGITCDTCHVVENGIALEGLAWLNTATGEHEPVGTPNELCAKCHATTSGVEISGGTGVDHQVALGGSAHLNWAGAWPQSYRPQYCSDCHNPHSTEPLQCEDCHSDIAESTTHMNGLNAVMLDKVTCMACHDASGLEVGPHADEMGGVFVTLVSSMDRQGQVVSEYVHSHSIQWQVSCDRCHFAENAWGLPVLTAEGESPAEE
jgi:hypothetical protein